MRKNYFLVAILGLFITTASAQFTKNDVEYWIGEGPDSAVFLVDFNESTTNNSLAFGFLFDASTTISAKAMLDSLAANVAEFGVTTPNGFLDSLGFESLVGLGGTDSKYWATYSGTQFSDLTMNAGISEVLSNNSWFACSFTAFDSNPPYNTIETISEPIAVENPTANINNQTKLAQFKAFKNVNSELVVNGLNGTLTINDLNGKTVYRAQHSNSSTISNLNQGVYILTLETQNGIISTKIYF
ncbi:MAG: T9SS type A sorting domain-containing protein [Bacteroidota bacterium]